MDEVFYQAALQVHSQNQEQPAERKNDKTAINKQYKNKPETKKTSMNDFNESLQNKSNDELLKMVYEFDLWNSDMLGAVEKELSSRGILPDDIAERKKKLADAEEVKLSKGREASTAGLIIGWITVFGIPGLIIGYNYAFSKQRNRYSGKIYFKYDKKSRNNGAILFYTSIVLSIIAILYVLLPD
jgi:hypothetical protein